MQEPHARQTYRDVRLQRAASRRKRRYDYQQTLDSANRAGIAIVAVTAGFATGLLVVGFALWGLLR